MVFGLTIDCISSYLNCQYWTLMPINYLFGTIDLIYFSAHICKWSLLLALITKFSTRFASSEPSAKSNPLVSRWTKAHHLVPNQTSTWKIFELLSRLYHWKILYKFGNNYCLVKRELKVWFFSMIIVALSFFYVSSRWSNITNFKWA